MIIPFTLNLKNDLVIVSYFINLNGTCTVYNETTEEPMLKKGMYLIYLLQFSFYLRSILQNQVKTQLCKDSLAEQCFFMGTEYFKTLGCRGGRGHMGSFFFGLGKMKFL